MKSAEKLRKLKAELALAHAEAERYSFDLPSPDALRRAEQLLSLLAAQMPEVGAVDVAVGDDGTVEITTTARGERFTIDIVPSGQRIEMVIQDAASGAIIGSTAATEKDIVNRIERAA
jgi:hypothetical protein